MSEETRNLNEQYYRRYYQFPGRSRWMEKIWLEAFGEEYPINLHHYGYVTRHDLKVLASRLTLPEGSILLDMACGKGGPGLYLAQECNFRLIGIDLIPEAVVQAHVFQESFDLAYPARFEVGAFAKIPLEDESVDAVISVDSLWAASDKIQALKEIKRVMKPGALLLFTHWDVLGTNPIKSFTQTGLKYVSRDNTPNWKAYQRKVYEGIMRYEKELRDEMGKGADMLLYEAKASPPYLDLSIRRMYHMERR